MLERLGEGQASGEPMNAFEPVDRTGIRAFEDDLARVGRDADQFEQPGEASAGLSRLGYRAGRPRDAPWGRLEFSATVACAFQDHSQCATLQAPQPVEIERDRSVVAPQLQRPSCGIVCRRGEMAPDECSAVGMSASSRAVRGVGHQRSSSSGALSASLWSGIVTTFSDQLRHPALARIGTSWKYMFPDQVFLQSSLT